MTGSEAVEMAAEGVKLEDIAEVEAQTTEFRQTVEYIATTLND